MHYGRALTVTTTVDSIRLYLLRGPGVWLAVPWWNCVNSFTTHGFMHVTAELTVAFSRNKWPHTRTFFTLPRPCTRFSRVTPHTGDRYTESRDRAEIVKFVYISWLKPNRVAYL